MEIKIKLKPINTPNFVLSEPRPGKREDGPLEPPKFALSEIDEETLHLLCEQFRKDVFKKAGKTDPREPKAAPKKGTQI